MCLRTFCGAQPPDAGFVSIRNQDIHDRASFSLRRAIHKACKMLPGAISGHQHNRVVQVGVQLPLAVLKPVSTDGKGQGKPSSHTVLK
jgi:hypothetical protein